MHEIVIYLALKGIPRTPENMFTINFARFNKTQTNYALNAIIPDILCSIVYRTSVS